MKALAGLCALALAAGCATAPQDDLLGSSAVVAALERERAPVVEIARFSQKRASEPLPERWKTYVVVPWKPRTQYALVESEGQVALEARSERAASGLYRYVRVRPQTHPTLEWRWRVPRLIEGADPRLAAREDSPVRVVVSFHGDAAKLGEGDRAKMRMAKALSGRAMPYATLMYIWSNDLPVGTVVHNPHIGRVRMIVAESGTAKLGRWVKVRRNVYEDFRKAFGENPWDVVAVGVMTDSDNTGSSTLAQYGDISFLEAGRP
ncbi:MAG TPA: DUF3047 domain-containing protein [Burkholderiales bacterium]|nr:DUF3047 domain-containing protein [Burkholderiales bacterium]